MEEEIISEKRYSIPYEMFGEAFKTFQKKFVYPRNYLMSGLLVIAAALNVVNIVLGKGSTFGYVLVLACLGLAFVNWYNPKKLRRNLMQSIKGIENDVYRLKMLPEKLIIGTVEEVSDSEEKPEDEEYDEVFGNDQPEEKINDSEIYLNSGVIVLDKPDYMMVYLKKSMFYVLPKKDFTEEEITVMQIHFQKQLGSNYRKYEK